jgi:hypothetical protein
MPDSSRKRKPKGRAMIVHAVGALDCGASGRHARHFHTGEKRSQFLAKMLVCFNKRDDFRGMWVRENVSHGIHFDRL